LRASGEHGGTMFPEPVRDRCRCSNGPADEDAFAAASQTANEHSTSGAHADFSEVFAVVARPFELPFLVDVGAAATVGVNQRGVQHEPVSIRKDQVFGEDGDGGLAGYAARFVGFSD